jgi:hypothetical protein
MIEVEGVTNRYGDKREVEALTSTVEPGDRHRLPRTERGRQLHTMRMIVGVGAPTRHHLAPRTGFAQLCGYAVVALAPAAVLRRDAER